MSWKWKGQGREGGRVKRSAAAEGAIRERERQTIHGCQQPKDSYANWAEMRCGALIYTRGARDWRELQTIRDSPFHAR